MSKNLSFEFAALCGVSYECGDIRFASDGSALLSPVGHRVTRFGLSGGGADSSASTYPFETLAPTRRIAVSKACLAIVDSKGRGFLCNNDTGAVLYRFNLKGECSKLEFSPDGMHLAAAIGNKIQVWRRPAILAKSVSGLILEHEFTAHSSNITSLDWSSPNNFISGSADCTVRLQYFRLSEETQEDEQVQPWQRSVSLVGSKSKIIGCYLMETSSMEDRCIITIAEDGAVFEWRFTAKPETTGKHRAKRTKSNDNKDETTQEWVLKNRHYVQPGSNATISSVASNHRNLLLVGFSDGIFSLFETPSLQKLQSLSASKFALDAAAITPDGAWIGLASSTVGQLLVWEWLSETFVLRQQGHYYNLNSVAYSPDGRVMASGGDDGKVKLWSTATNTSFVTFPEHEGAVTALTFASNSALVTCSLDGTCRAFDLVRLRNFRTMTPPEPCQLLSIAASDDGDVICAGAMEPPHIFMWSLRTGKILDILKGHTGPVSSLEFNPVRPVLASSSWDGTVKLWEPFTSTAAIETLVHARSDTATPVNQLCVAFRPDGKALVSAGLDGSILVWNLEDSSLRTSMDCRRDLGVSDKVNSFFTSLCYSADGRVVLAGGKSAWVFAYDVEREVLLKKYLLAHRVREDTNGLVEDEADEARKTRWKAASHLPGVSRGRDAGKREAMDPEATASCIRFSPTGRSWAAATPLGLLVFSLDHSANFDPVNIDEDCTPQSTRAAAKQGDYAKAVSQALFLGEPSLIAEMIQVVPLESLTLVAKSIPKSHVPRCFAALAQMIEESTSLEYHMRWILALFSGLSEADIAHFRTKLMPSFRSVQRSVLRQDKLLSKLCDENMYDLDYILG